MIKKLKEKKSKKEEKRKRIQRRFQRKQNQILKVGKDIGFSSGLQKKYRS